MNMPLNEGSFFHWKRWHFFAALGAASSNIQQLPEHPVSTDLVIYATFMKKDNIILVANMSVSADTATSLTPVKSPNTIFSRF